MSANELSRMVRIDTIGAVPRTIEVEAGAAERDALARRFDLLAVERLRAVVELTSGEQGLVARGRMEAAVVQSCVASGDAVPSRIEEWFAVTFRPERANRGVDEEVEIAAGELDICFYEGASVDVGEAVAQTLALSLDPYPRAPAAAEALKKAGVKNEGEAGPFGALAGLRDKLAPRSE